MASRGGLGGAARRRAVGRRRRLALGLPGAAGAAWRVAARRGARDVVLQSEPKPWGRRVGSGAWLQLARSGRVQCTHTRCSTQCRGMLQVAGEDGIYQIEVRSNGESSGHASLIRGASSQCKDKNMSKLIMLSRCLIKCQWHLGMSWSGQKHQMGVSLDAKESGVVSWTKGETC